MQIDLDRCSSAWLFRAVEGVCELRCAWFEARRPPVGDLALSGVRGEHLTMRVEGVRDEPV
jgi:hypothetical protein